MSEGLFKAFLILSSLVTHSIRGILTAVGINAIIMILLVIKK